MEPSESHHSWLNRQLSLWQEEGLLSEDVIESLRRRYPPSATGGRGSINWMTVILGVFGSVLVMGGVILLFAHNWYGFSRIARTAMAITPLLGFQILGFWILKRQKTSSAWREGVGVGLTLSIGAAIALIAQTYQMGGDFGRFMLVWALLTLPVVYLFKAGSALWLYLVGAVIYAGFERDVSDSAPWFYALFLGAIPFLIWVQSSGRHRTLTLLTKYALALSVWMGLPLAMDYNAEGAWLPALSCLGGAMILWDRPPDGRIASVRRHPFALTAALFFAGLIFSFSFEEVWEEYGYGNKFVELSSSSTLLLLLGVVVIWASGVVYRFKVRDGWSVCFGAAFPLLTFVAWGVAGAALPLMLATNIIGVVIGVSAVVVALRDKRLSLLNYGLLLVGGLVLLRFFDSGLGFVPRGLAFIALGIGFLTTNIIFVRHSRNSPQTQGGHS